MLFWYKLDILEARVFCLLKLSLIIKYITFSINCHTVSCANKEAVVQKLKSWLVNARSVVRIQVMASCDVRKCIQF